MRFWPQFSLHGVRECLSFLMLVAGCRLIERLLSARLFQLVLGDNKVD